MMVIGSLFWGLRVKKPQFYHSLAFSVELRLAGLGGHGVSGCIQEGLEAVRAEG